MKSARNEYSESPFYYTEVFEGAPRTIAWHESTDSQIAIFYELLDLLEDRVEYLFKEDTGETDGHEKWSRISGGIYKSALIELIQKHEKWFFGDSVFQFCFREPESESYVAYDEHGLFFIYNMTDCEKTLQKQGLQNVEKELITAKPHWAVRVKDSEQKLGLFKEDLKEKSVFYDDEAEPAGSS